MTTARAMAPNYIFREQQILLDLIKEYPAVECKQTDRESHAKKLKGWETITDEFNSYSTECKRSTKNLQNLWKNMKARAKDDYAASKRESRGTGGGPLTHQSHPLSSQVMGT